MHRRALSQIENFLILYKNVLYLQFNNTPSETISLLHSWPTYHFYVHHIVHFGQGSFLSRCQSRRLNSPRGSEQHTPPQFAFHYLINACWVHSLNAYFVSCYGLNYLSLNYNSIFKYNDLRIGIELICCCLQEAPWTKMRQKISWHSHTSKWLKSPSTHALRHTTLIYYVWHGQN